MDKIFGSSRQKNRVFALVFAAVWGGMVLWNFSVPSQAFSQAENRDLEQFPAYTAKRLLDGDFMEDMNEYMNDQFVQRPWWVSAQSLMEYAVGKREINGVYVGGNALYRHYVEADAALTDINIEGINTFCKRYGIPVSVMLVPSSTYVRQDDLPALAAAWDEGAYIDGVYGRLANEVDAIDITRVMRQAADEPIYYRTDHHWTSYGAYLGYRALAEQRGLPVRDGELHVSTLSDDFLGTNHSRTGLPFVTPDTLELYQIGSVLGYETYGITGNDYATAEYDSIYFPEYLQQKDKYSYFLGQLRAYVTIYTGADTGKKLIIFKDSYAHCLAPMLLADYSEIRLVDLRSFRADDYGAFVQAENYDEALFLYSTDTFSQQRGPGWFAQEA